MSQVVIVSDAMEELAVRELVPDSEVVIFGLGMDQKIFKGREALIWFNRQKGYRETVDFVGKILLKHCSKVVELVNEEEGIGFSPSQALEMEMTPETFVTWAKTVARPVSPGSFRELEEIQPQGEFLDWSDNAFETWTKAKLVISRSGIPVVNEDNILRILEGVDFLQGAFWLDSFSGAPMFTMGGKTKQWTDSDSMLLCVDMQRKLGFATLKHGMVHNSVMVACARNAKHPVRDWLGGLKWDEKPRIENFLRDCMGAEDTAFNRAVSKNFFLCMVARIYEPGCKVDTMMILEGKQGRRKSSALKALVGEWFVECNESLAGNHKDFLAILHGKMIAEIAELDSFSKAEANKIKAIMSTAADRYRPPYGRLPETFPRTSIFVGTTNDHAYLTDPTGGRRFWPVKIGLIDMEAIKRDRDQLFAEAVVEYRLGKTWWEVPEAEALQNQEERRRVNPWEQLIREYLLCKDEANVNDILENCLKLEIKDMTNQNSHIVINCLKALGWQSKPIRRGKEVYRAWKKCNDHVTSEVTLLN